MSHEILMILWHYFFDENIAFNVIKFLEAVYKINNYLFLNSLYYKFYKYICTSIFKNFIFIDIYLSKYFWFN